MDREDIPAAKLKMVQDAIEQVRRMGDDPPKSKKPERKPKQLDGGVGSKKQKCPAGQPGKLTKGEAHSSRITGHSVAQKLKVRERPAGQSGELAKGQESHQPCTGRSD